MSSGDLPMGRYHRAQSLGSGSYGSVVAVYNDDGEEFAMKLFIEDEDDEAVTPGLDLGALREISILRLLRKGNAHENIIEIDDIKVASDGESDDQAGAGIDNTWLGVTMPLYKAGTLSDAINEGKLTNKRIKVAISHGILSAVAFLHDNGIIHRDIKSDNIMLEYGDDGTLKPVLIDFSLAKVIDGSMYRSNNITLEETTTHTGSVGTVTYTAPEVVECKPYGFKSDLWSIGVILLEMIQNHTIEAEKNKEALKMIEIAKDNLPDQPLPNLIRGLLTINPKHRLSARLALQSPVFLKFGFQYPSVTLIDLDSALPLTGYNSLGNYDNSENKEPNTLYAKKNSKNNPDSIVMHREAIIRGLCAELDLDHPMTVKAALCYAQQLYQLDDTIDDLNQSQGLLDCVVLASRFFEIHLLDLNEVSGCSQSFSDWDLESYLDTESTIWMLMDYCLLPRGLSGSAI
jgi:serine/threonine protein kinase